MYSVLGGFNAAVEKMFFEIGDWLKALGDWLTNGHSWYF
jgi:hypothetical protein